MEPTRKDLGEAGQCCGRKPLTYKRKGVTFCLKCKAEHDITTGKQVANALWRAADTGFVPAYPDNDYARTAYGLPLLHDKKVTPQK